MIEIIKRLTELLLWSDRLGSFEIHEIKEIIKDLKTLSEDDKK
jgi:hypothetical protein